MTTAVRGFFSNNIIDISLKVETCALPKRVPNSTPQDCYLAHPGHYLSCAFLEFLNFLSLVINY